MKLDYSSDISDSVTGARALTVESASLVLNRILESCQNRFVLFDLDSTLLDNRGRNATIMREFGEDHKVELLQQAEASHWQDWSAENTMVLMGVPRTDIDRHLNAYTSFWSERFFTSHYCQYDTGIFGAVSFVNDLQRAGAVVRYLTGRHEGMRDGTANSLNDLGFPISGTGEVELIMKPSQSISDDDYKKDVMAKFSTEHELLAAFDNEPYHINAYRAAFPKATCVHLHTDHSMRPIRLLDGIVSILNFARYA